MIKWLVISCLVITVFCLILLGFGKLLYDNEQRVQSYKEELTVKQSSDQVTAAVTKEAVPSAKQESKTSINKTIIATNLTCVSDSQCMVVEVSFADLDCKVAINTIGAALLAKAEQDTTKVGSCLLSSSELKAQCQNNLCTLLVQQ